MRQHRTTQAQVDSRSTLQTQDSYVYYKDQSQSSGIDEYSNDSSSRDSDISRQYGPLSTSYQGCIVQYEDSQDFNPASSSSYSHRTWEEQSARPSTAHARLQRPWLPPRLDTIPATSQEFAELFPSSRELRIQHDDGTLDGNMNLKIDTHTTDNCGLTRSVILFHLRMYDLKSRDFSLRRYCRNSGREVCHSLRKSNRRISRPAIQRSIGNAFAALKSKADALHLHHSPQDEAGKQPVELQRHDSGYDSTWDNDEAEEDEDDARASSSQSAPTRSPSNDADPINLEFSNYAHVDLRRKGLKGHKRYEFSYWGESYAWNVMVQKVGPSIEVSYTLLRRQDGHVVARIMPQPLSEGEARAEVDKGGWIPPCRMRITDEKLPAERSADLADVVVMTGLTALVDDGIRRHFHQRSIKQQLASPLSKLQTHRQR